MMAIMFMRTHFISTTDDMSCHEVAPVTVVLSPMQVESVGIISSTSLALRTSRQLRLSNGRRGANWH